jgi:integrase/recombinase XerD
MSDLVPVSLADLDRARTDRVAADLAAAWLSSLRSPSTRAGYAADFARWAGWLADHDGPAILAARFLHVEAYARYMREVEEPTPKPTTQARRLAAVSSFYRYAVKCEAIDRNPAHPELVDRPPTGPDHVKLTPALTEAEIDRLLVAASGPQDRALVLLLSTTAMRVSEALSLNVDTITTERGHTVVTVTGKGGKVNTAPIVPRLSVDLDAIRQERTTGPLFTAEHGGRMTRQGAARVLTRLGHRAGLGKPVTPHMLRASAITNALDDGVPPAVVQHMARHSSLSTTMRYNRAAYSLDVHPAYRLATRLASVRAS